MIFRNGLVALPGETEFRRASIRVRGERVAEVAQSLEPRPARRSVDASGLLVLPGAIDPHVHFDEPGFTSREDFRHGSSEAARGGVTTVIDMPCTSLPPVIDRGRPREQARPYLGRAQWSTSLCTAASRATRSRRASAQAAARARWPN